MSKKNKKKEKEFKKKGKVVAKRKSSGFIGSIISAIERIALIIKSIPHIIGKAIKRVSMMMSYRTDRLEKDMKKHWEKLQLLKKVDFMEPEDRNTLWKRFTYWVTDRDDAVALTVTKKEIKQYIEDIAA